MYAVVRTGGKQYKVAKENVIVVEKLDGEIGQIIELGEVLAMDLGDGLTVGEPLVNGARVTATVLDQKKDAKVIIFKKKRRKNYRRRRGHRQPVTVLRIGEILPEGQEAAETLPELTEPDHVEQEAISATAVEHSADGQEPDETEMTEQDPEPEREN